MLKRDEFVKFILEGSDTAVSSAAATEKQSALPSGFEGFETKATHAVGEASSFARRLLEASGFGPAQYLEREEVILGGDASAKYLPDRVYYWPKTNQRPYQTILFELDQSGTELLQAPLFRPLKGQEILEDALSRLVQMALAGFERGGEKRTAAVKQGRQTETLCVVSVHDNREDASAPPCLVCLGTVSAETEALETFHIREAARRWERPLAEDHLTRLYDRHFSKLDSARWQDAFISGEERKLAEKLLEACTGSAVSEKSIQNKAIALLEELARGFGLRRKPNHDTRLTLYSLPADHDIGADAEALEAKKEANPFKGVALRDEGERLLGYIIYCVNGKKRADELRAYLAKNNRFHNVLVIYPSGKEAVLELWQGQSCLEGKLTQQGARFEGAGKTVNLLSRFFVVSRARMKNPKELAEELAYRARYLRRLALRQLGQEKKHDHLRSLHEAFKESLVHEQTEEQFADAYAQTITYGLLAARWMSKDELGASAERFTRENALKYVQRTSPFLREFFKEVLTAGAEVKLNWLRDDIIDLLARAEIDAVFGSGDVGGDQSTDPVIHFYEPFLAAFDKQTKVQRGVFYTPRPVVSYIVRSVHELLQTEFGLEDGLASTITWGEMSKRVAGLTIPDGVKTGEPFVTILDPATGTATFPVQVIDVIHRTLVERWTRQRLTAAQQRAAWNEYVPKHLLPRLCGYELMVAPYAIAHMKIALRLKQSGYDFGSDERVRIYLTNALEPASDDRTQREFEQWAPALAHEAQAVNAIKRHQRFTVIIGNPPYSGISSNRNDWIEGLLRGDVPGCQHRVSNYYEIDGHSLGEKKLWLQDDYVKFMRLSHFLLEGSSVGIHGMITNHSYVDSPTCRGMRFQMLGFFSHLNFVDLHGSTKKREEPPDLLPDENVFDILPGVAISVCARTGQRPAGRVQSADLWGTRSFKSDWLLLHGLKDTHWTRLAPAAPYYLFVKRQLDFDSEYRGYFSLKDIFPFYGTGIQTSRDDFATDWNRSNLEERLREFFDLKKSDRQIVDAFGLSDTRGWKIKDVRRTSSFEKVRKTITQCLFRAFDTRWIALTKDIVDWPRVEVMSCIAPDRPGLLCSRQQSTPGFRHALVVNAAVDMFCISNKSREGQTLFPLFVQDEEGLFRSSGGSGWRPNLGAGFAGELGKLLSTHDEKVQALTRAHAMQTLNYLYAILYSPTYRSRYADLLKMDYPRMPIALHRELFRALVELGGKLVDVHLMKTEKSKRHIAQLVGSGTPEVERIAYADRTVWIDKAKTRGFRGVPGNVWEFYVGGYKVCEKWLKDRKGRVLSKQEIEHYQGIVVALNETIRLMGEIDRVINQHGGWPGAFTTAEAKPA